MAKRPPTSSVLGARAQQEIDAARDWWTNHRGTNALDNAITGALDRIEQFPEIGALVKKRGKWSRTRRYILSDVGYHLYYDYDARTGIILW